MPRPGICLRDLSKFGTFVNKTIDPKPLFSLPDKVLALKEGDLISFGTNNSTYRLDFLPLILHVPPLADKRKRDSLLKAITSIGGYTMEEWSAECTHLVVEEGSLVTETVIAAVAKRKFIISTGWIDAVLARSSPSAEFPSFSRFTPTLSYRVGGDFLSLKVAEPEVQSTVFKGFIFFIGPLHMYANKEHLQWLVEVSGGDIVPLSQRHSHLQVMNDTMQKEMLIIPAAAPRLQKWLSAEDFKLVLNMPRTSEDKIIAAVLAGQVDYNALEVPPSPAASRSSDETVEAEESDNDGSDGVMSHQVMEMDKVSISMSCLEMQKPASASASQLGQGMVGDAVFLPSRGSKTMTGPVSTSRSKPSLVEEQFKGVRRLSQGILTVETTETKDDNRVEIKPLCSTKVEGSIDSTSEPTECSKSDILYSSDLIICKGGKTKQVSQAVQNFKCFRKKQGTSGNSFGALIPFAKEPYRESDYGQEIQDFMQREKKRKEAEALAEDLFNAEKLKRQKASVSEVIGRSGLISTQQRRYGGMKAR